MKWGLSILAVAVALSMGRQAAQAAPALPVNAPAVDRQAVIIQVSGFIDDYTRDRLVTDIDKARKLGAKIVILNLDTYGGDLAPAMEISRFIKRQDDLHIIAYVQDKAISAGAMIAVACNEIVVSSEVQIGDCAPILLNVDSQQLQNLNATERAKIQSPVLDEFQDSAIHNHYDPVLLAAMVAVDHSVYWIQNAKREKRFVSESDYTDLVKKGWVSIPGEPCPINKSTELLILSSTQAIRYGLATGPFGSPESLAASRGYIISADLTPGLGEHLVEFLSGNLMRSILVGIFFLCLYAIPHAPGHGVAEFVGLSAIILLLGIPLLTGRAEWWEVLMIFVGLSFVAFEILLPGHVFPGVSGAILVLAGLVLTFVPKDAVGYPAFVHPGMFWVSLRPGLAAVAGAMASALFLWLWLGRFLPKLPYVNRLILTTTTGNVSTKADAAKFPSASTWPLVGSVGKAVSELKPGGTAEFFDPGIAEPRPISVVSESGFIEPGKEVIVRAVKGPTILVKRRA